MSRGAASLVLLELDQRGRSDMPSGSLFRAGDPHETENPRYNHKNDAKSEAMSSLRARSKSRLSETHGLARVNDLRRNFRSAANAKFHEEVRISGVRSCRICEQGLYPKIRDRHLPGKWPKSKSSSLEGRLITIHRPESHHLVLQLLNSCNS